MKNKKEKNEKKERSGRSSLGGNNREGGGRDGGRGRDSCKPTGKSNGKSSDTPPREERRKKVAKEIFPQHMPLNDALKAYADDPGTYIRGTLRVAGSAGQRMKAFVSCDRGSLRHDAIVSGLEETNRALDGDTVFLEILGPVDKESTIVEMQNRVPKEQEEEDIGQDAVSLDSNIDFDNIEVSDGEARGDDREGSFSIDQELAEPTWRQDNTQRSLWNPLVDIKRHSSIRSEYASRHATLSTAEHGSSGQMRGRVVHVCGSRGGKPRIIVGTLKRQQQGQNGRILLVPSNKALPYFVVPRDAERHFKDKVDRGNTGGNPEGLYQAEYNSEAWMTGMRFPPCRKVQKMGNSFDPEHETQALLIEHDVNHGDFPPPVLRDVERAVKSGRTRSTAKSGADGTDGKDLGWAPTKAMNKGRRDYRDERIFTIDPTTAKDLDDALHIKPLPNDQVEIGVHIADVSHFIKPQSHVDQEAAYRATTVYLVDRSIPMLPRPLCEIACSLNENVERLAFSCVWVMNMDGTMAKADGSKSKNKNSSNGLGKGQKVWYGRTVIKSCSRLDYNTAQNIIDGRCGNANQTSSDVSEDLWPRSRRPTGGHTMVEVANDVRLMHKVAMARRRLRFDNGALALSGVKLVFRLANDNKTPQLCEPYPIKDSNRLVEEYMLMANYLVAQRLITHAGDIALLRHHPPPLEQGLDEITQVARELGFQFDTSNSASIQESLRRISNECTDDVVLQGVTELMMAPMQPAEYIAAGAVEDPTHWRHFALCIPYYTHFTSPIRRYADVIVHRLLQATLEGPEAVKEYKQSINQISTVTSHCNDKRMASKRAQERSDRVFLSLYLRENPIPRVMGIVVSIGVKSFTVFVPSLGFSQRVILDEHDHLSYEPSGDDTRKSITVRSRSTAEDTTLWTGGTIPLEVKVFAKVCVRCTCKVRSPIDVVVHLIGPWR